MTYFFSRLSQTVNVVFFKVAICQPTHRLSFLQWNRQQLPHPVNQPANPQLPTATKSKSKVQMEPWSRTLQPFLYSLHQQHRSLLLHLPFRRRHCRRHCRPCLLLPCPHTHQQRLVQHGNPVTVRPTCRPINPRRNLQHNRADSQTLLHLLNPAVSLRCSHPDNHPVNQLGINCVVHSFKF